MTQTQQTSGGSRDCGRFFLDVAGQYLPEQVRIEWAPQTRPEHPEVDGLIEQTWQQQTSAAQQTGRRLFNGKLCRLIECDSDRTALRLTTGPVSYKEFLGTNLSNAYLRYTHGPEMLANALGVSAAPVTRDGFLLLGRRSPRVAYHPGRLHPLGGMLEPGDDTSSPPCPFGAVITELIEETGISREAITNVVCLGMVRDKHIVQPELVFDVTLDLDVQQVHEARPNASDAMEHAELVPVRDHPAAVVTFIEHRTDELTPVALATLLLHGMRAWGSGWFAAARGYLRTMF